MCVVPTFFFLPSSPLILERCQGEPYRFSHFLFISHAYHLSEEEGALLADPSTRRQPRSKKMRPATSEQQQERQRDGVYLQTILLLRYPPRSLRFLYGRVLTLTLLKGILAHADVHLYDTWIGGEGERGIWVGYEGTNDVGSAC